MSGLQRIGEGTASNATRARRVLKRLRDEHGFTDDYTIVKDYIRKRERRGRGMFVPLTCPPGHAQADFGEATIIIDGVEQKARFPAFDLPPPTSGATTRSLCSGMPSTKAPISRRITCGPGPQA